MAFFFDCLYITSLCVNQFVLLYLHILCLLSFWCVGAPQPERRKAQLTALNPNMQPSLPEPQDLCWGIVSLLPSRSTMKVTSQERRCQGCRVRGFFKDKNWHATLSPGSIPSCPSLICISAPGQLFLVPTADLYRAENRNKLQQTAFRSRASFLKAYWSISTLQCKLHCRYSLSVTRFIYTYPWSLEEKARRHARQFFLQEFYRRANPYFPRVNFASGTDANQHLRQRANYFAAHAIPSLSKLILHKTIA